MALLRCARLLLLATLLMTQSACLPVNEVLTGREIECTGAPEAACLRAVQYMEGVLAHDLARLSNRITKVIAAANTCDGTTRAPPNAFRCWAVRFQSTDTELGGVVYELPNGSFT